MAASVPAVVEAVAAPVGKSLVVKGVHSQVLTTDVHDTTTVASFSFDEFKARYLVQSSVTERHMLAVWITSPDDAPSFDDFVTKHRMKDTDVLLRSTTADKVIFLAMKTSLDQRKWGPKEKLSFHKVVLPNRAGNQEIGCTRSGGQ